MGQKSSSLALKKSFKFFEYSQYLYNKNGSFFLLKDYFLRQTLKQFFKQNKYMLNNLLILQSENKIQIILNFLTKKDLYKKLRFTKASRKRFGEKKRFKKHQKKIQRKLLLTRLLQFSKETNSNRIYKASWKQTTLNGVDRLLFLKKSYKNLLNLNLFSRSTTQILKNLKKNKILKKRLNQTLLYFYLSVLWKKSNNKLFLIYFFHKINLYLNTFESNLFFNQVKKLKKNYNLYFFLKHSGSLVSISNRFSTLKKTAQLNLLKTTNLSYTLFNKFFFYQNKKKLNFYSLNQLYKFNFFKKINLNLTKYTYKFKFKKNLTFSRLQDTDKRVHYKNYLLFSFRKLKQKKNRKRQQLLFKRNKRRKYKKTIEDAYTAYKFYKKTFLSYDIQDTFNIKRYNDSRAVRDFTVEDSTTFIFRKKKNTIKKLYTNTQNTIKQYNFFFKKYLVNKYNLLTKHSNINISFFYQLYITTFRNKKNLKFRFKFNNHKLLKYKKQRALEKMPRCASFEYISFYDRKKIFKSTKNKRKKFFYIFYYYNFDLSFFKKTKNFLGTSKMNWNLQKTTSLKTYKTIKFLKKFKNLKKQTVIFKKRKNNKKITQQQKNLKIKFKKFKLAKSILKTLNHFSWFKKMRNSYNFQPISHIQRKFKKYSKNLQKQVLFLNTFETHLQLLNEKKQKVFLNKFFYTTFKLTKHSSNSKVVQNQSLCYITSFVKKKTLKTVSFYKFTYFRILLQQYKYFLKKKKYLMSSLLQKLLTKFILAKTVEFSKTSLKTPRFEKRLLKYYKKPFIRKYKTFLYKYKKGKLRVKTAPLEKQKKYFHNLKLELEKPNFYRFIYKNPNLPYFYIKSLFGSHGHVPSFKLKSLFKQLLQNALYRFKYHTYKNIYGFNPLSGKRLRIADTESPLFGHYPLVFLHRKRRNKYIKKIRRIANINTIHASRMLEDSVKNSRQLIEKLTNLHLTFFYKQRLSTKINTKKLNSVLLQKLTLILKKYYKINNIQLCLYYKLYKFLQKYKQKKLILYKFNKLFFKKQTTINTITCSSVYCPQTLHSFLTFKHLNYKQFNNFTYFRILKQKFFTKKFFKNNELILILLNCLFFRTSTVYLASYICTIFKKLKQHNLLLAHLDRLIKYFFKGFTVALPITGLKFIIKGRINGVPRKKTRIYSYGITQSQTLKTSFDYHQTTAFTRYGTFGLRFWRYF